MNKTGGSAPSPRARRQTSRSAAITRGLAIPLVAVLALASVAIASAGPVAAQPVSDQAFSASGSGTVLGVNVLRLGNVQTLNAQVGFAGQSMNSKGLTTAITNELGYVTQPSQSGKSSYARGSGLEIGLLTPHPANPDPNQIALAGLAQSSAPPIAGPVVKQIGPISLGSVLYASLLRSTTKATSDPTTCAVGKPVAFGQAEVARVDLLNTGGTGPSGEFLAPLVSTSLTADRNVAQTRTFSYLMANGDGTFGVVSETHQQVLPVNLLNGAITIELLGEWVLRTTATGKPGGAKVEYAPVGAGPQTPVVRIKLFNNPPLTLNLQQILGPNGIDLSIPGLITLRVGTPPRPIGNTASPQPPAPVAANGTSASAAVDVVQLKVLDLPGLTGLDLRIGHMESSVTAPTGGVTCEFPVSKTAQPDPVIAGGTITQTITIPSDAGAFAALFDCDLVGIRAEDVVSVKSGNPSFRITSASKGGTISADGRSVNWANLGTYRPGDPPIVLTMQLAIPANSPAGVLQDTVKVTANLGNCKGGGGGSALVGTAQLNGSVMTGSSTLPGPTVVVGTGGSAAAATVGGVNGTGSTSTVPVTVLGNRFTQPTTPAGGGGDVARTGFNVAAFVAVATFLLAFGASLVTVGRRWLYDG
jgi:hypothetical protein